MKRLALLFLIACASKPKPPACATACDHVLDLMAARLADHLDRARDHSDPATAAHLEETAAQDRETERAQCLARCTPESASCLTAATTVETAQSCL
jgi:hypothetical protein